MKPIAKCVGQDGNVFNILGICSKALKKNNQHKEASQMQQEVFEAESYDHALQIMMKYVDMR